MSETDNRPNPCEPSKPAQRVIQAEALHKQAVVGANHGDLLAGRDRREAARLRKEARWRLTPADLKGRGAGQEMKLHVHMPDWRDRELIDTVKKPDVVTATATVERLRQAEAAGCVDTALDVADTIKPRNSIERMLAHQLAAAHNAAMRMTGLAMGFCHNAEHSGMFPHSLERTQMLAAEASRASIAGARMMTAFQEGVLALAKLRSGGRQTVVVQHIDNRGGQAVVAGEVQAARRRKGEPS